MGSNHGGSVKREPNAPERGASTEASMEHQAISTVARALLQRNSVAIESAVATSSHLLAEVSFDRADTGDIRSCQFTLRRPLPVKEMAAAFGPYEIDESLHHPGDHWVIVFARVAQATGQRVALYCDAAVSVDAITSGDLRRCTLIVWPDPEVR